MHSIFVYGTLKTGFPNFHFLDLKSVSASTVEQFPLVIDSPYNIPFMLNKPGLGKNIQGEVFAVDDKKLELLDELEHHPKLYRRTLIKVRLESSNEEIECQSYLLNDFKPSLLELPFLENYKKEDSSTYVAKIDRKSDISVMKSVKLEI